jgi:hypothetical protein
MTGIIENNKKNWKTFGLWIFTYLRQNNSQKTGTPTTPRYSNFNQKTLVA